MVSSTVRANGIVSLKDIVDEWMRNFKQDQFDQWELMWWEYDTGTYHVVDSMNPASLFGGTPKVTSGDGQFVVRLLVSDGVVDSDGS